jgi:N-carbamoyl-L-amino-acid hydrolase
VGSPFEELFAGVAAVGRSERGWTRPPWSVDLRAAEAVVVAAADGCGLVAAHDAAGNLWLTDPSAPAEGLVAAGSHLDSVPDGGAYDGALGVVCALVAVARLRAERVTGFERLAVVSFADEEGWRFGTPIFGSRMLTGAYGPEVLDRLDDAGVRLADVGPTDPVSAAGGHRRLACFVEVHVEQGVALAPAGVPVGVATGLAARSRLRFVIEGEANHAGTTPMAGRRDALVAAARLVLAADACARQEHGGVATVGQLTVEPGGSNVIPGRVSGTLDARAPSPARRDALVAAITAASTEARFNPLADDPGVAFHERVRAALHRSAATAGVGAIDLASYAGHDAGVLALGGVAAGMLFVRSPDGISHSPAEHASGEDCEAAVTVLAGALADLLADPPPEGC